MKEQNFGNVKQLQKQNPLFSLIYLINENVANKSILNCFLIFANIILNCIIFLGLEQINILNNQILVLPQIANFIFFGLLGVILLQILICYFYQIQFFISVQWKTYRYVILPFLFSFLLSQAINPNLLDTSISIVLFLILIIISLILTAVFAVQSYVFKKLLHRDFPINWHLLILQIIFHLSCHIDNFNLRISCILVMTVLAVIQYKNNFSILKQDCYEYRLLAVSIFMFVWYGFILTISVFTENSQIKGLMIASIPCLCYKIIVDLIKDRAAVSYKAFCSIFEDPDTIKFQNFIDSLQPITEEIMQYYYSQQKKDFVQTLLISYYYQHSNRCLNNQCPFKNQDYKFQLKNMNDSKNMKDVLFKICKKIDYLYYGLYKICPQNVDLKLSLIQFYIFCYPNKIKALQIISQMQLSKLSIQQLYQLFKIKIQIQNMATLQVASQIKFDQKVIQFENLLYLTLNTLMQFWMLFSQQKIDFNRLIDITSKIFPLRQKIQQIFYQQLNAQTYSSLQILRLYSIYCLTIQNDQDKSFKLDDYLVKLKGKLQQHKQIQYLSFQSDIGLVALSLSQNKLGSIQMINNQACNIFNYTKKQFKSIRVNQIMPKTFSQQHDNYLKVFLQNKHKKINSDQRYLYGKSKQGYLFPISLQLQRTIPTTNQELLFIANIKRFKLKQSIIACITDQEGEIFDVSSTFDNLLLRQDVQAKQKKKSTGKISKNIQQFIPQFYNLSIQEDEHTRQKRFKNKINIKYYGDVQIHYTVTNVSFPLKPNGGFLIQGRIINIQKPLQFPQLSLTKSLNKMLYDQKVIAHKVYYDSNLNRFQICKIEEVITPNNQFANSFSLPFISIHDITSIFDKKNQVQQFGSQVKTIRLINDHFQRIQQASQFQSQVNIQSLKSKQTQNQIIQLKQQILNHSNPVFLINIKLALIILSLVCVIICFLLINYYYNYNSIKKNGLSNVKYKLETRGYLSEYITYFSALKSNFNTILYTPKLQQTQKILINSIQNSPIQELKKQKMLKIIYLQTQANLTQLLNDQTLIFNQDQQSPIQKILVYWYTFYVTFSILIILSMVSYFLFLNQLQSIYQVFMCLQEKIIKKMYQNCKNLATRIQTQNKKVQAQAAIKVRQSQYNEEEEQNPVKKVRKFKSGNQFRNFILLIKLIVPFIILIILTIVIVNLISIHDVQFTAEANIYKQIYQLAPQSSVYLMNTFLKNSQSLLPNVTQTFDTNYQQIQQVLFNFQNQNPGQISVSYFKTLFNNVCQQRKKSQQYNTFCLSISQGTLRVGLSKAINYIKSYLQYFQLNIGTISDRQRFNQLILLQYQFIFPIVLYMTQQMLAQLYSSAYLFEIQFTTLTIIVILLILFNYFYFLKYPANQIQEKLKLSKDLIQLLPEYNNDTKGKKGYDKVNPKE